MAKYRNPARRPRNTAPMWKKVTVVLSAPVAMVIVLNLLNARSLNYALVVIIALVVAVAAVWGTSKLLGVHLSLGSWD
jgi:hypothetical protein